VQSSNSLERERGPFWFLERSLDAIEREAPVAYGLIVRALGRRAIVIAIGDDVATLSMASGSHAIARDGGARGAVELSLTEAIVRAALAGDLVLRGAADDLAALHDALLAFIHGAVRSSSTPRLLESYLDRDAPSNGRPRSRGANHGERHGPPHR